MSSTKQLTPAQLLDQIDIDAYDRKNEQLIEHYANELSHVIRFAHKGFVLPIEVETSFRKVLHRLHTLQEGSQLTDDHGQQILINTLLNIQNSIKIEFTNLTTQKEYEFTLHYIHDPKRNSTGIPTREIDYKGNKYRSVLEDGTSYSHLHHQHSRFGSQFLTPLVEQNVISPTEKVFLELFHRIHDLTEINDKIGDSYAFEKSNASSHKEASLISRYMQQSDISYTPAEYQISPWLFIHNEGREKKHKAGEIIGYMKNALGVLPYPHYFNMRELTGPGTMVNNLNEVALNKSYTSIDPETLQIKSHKVLDLAPIRTFFKEQDELIGHMVQDGVDSYDEIATKIGDVDPNYAKEKFIQGVKSFESIRSYLQTNKTY